MRNLSLLAALLIAGCGAPAAGPSASVLLTVDGLD
jgi:hypothetical protein